MLEAYLSGGIWMHVITAWCLLAVGLMVRQWLRPQRRLLFLIWSAFGMALAAGLLGTVAGVAEALSALASQAPELRGELLFRALGIVCIPVAWALLLVLVLGHAAVPLTWWARRAPPVQTPR